MQQLSVSSVAGGWGAKQMHGKLRWQILGCFIQILGCRAAQACPLHASFDVQAVSPSMQLVRWWRLNDRWPPAAMRAYKHG